LSVRDRAIELTLVGARGSAADAGEHNAAVTVVLQRRRAYRHLFTLRCGVLFLLQYRSWRNAAEFGRRASAIS
jgi:hypothetical protein